MRTHVLAVLAALLLLLALGAGTAAAGEPTQAVGQDASSQQSASSNANATQVAPSNNNVDVRIFSPGNSGDVTQTNAAGALALAGNANPTDQSASQDQSGAGTQAVGQDATNDQSATGATPTRRRSSRRTRTSRCASRARATTVTSRRPTRRLAGAAAGNANGTTQNADQSQSGDSCKCGGGGGTQAVGQSADSKQSADADADATQIKPSNSNISVRIGSQGNGGDVTQTNAALAGALAGNVNQTDQSADQSQSAMAASAAAAASRPSARTPATSSPPTSDANAVQYKPSNDNTSVRIHSPGDDGDVTQTNLAAALGIAFNANQTDQSVTQSQGGDSCKCSGTPVQAVGQFAYNEQYADAEANAIPDQAVELQHPGPHRQRGERRLGDPDQRGARRRGGREPQPDEPVHHASRRPAAAESRPSGRTPAASRARRGCHAFQLKPSNSNAPVSIGGGHDKKHECGCEDEHAGGSGGDVTQTNLAGALGVALNANITDQSATQSQGGDSCKCSGGGLQAVGQSAWNKQDADGGRERVPAQAVQQQYPREHRRAATTRSTQCGCERMSTQGGSGGESRRRTSPARWALRSTPTSPTSR